MVVCNGASVTTIPNQFNILIKCVVFVRHGNIQALGGSTILMKVAVFKVILNITFLKFLLSYNSYVTVF